ncbi:hypothetical protein OS122_25905 [Mycolicibacterium mucogenicum]|uniref:hypothetical protein n=1 Tax=Mycolicibacterium mucogenicum TaxID=56689 RepID=UPI002269838C|nr:hypothetical protein [Mycolicibacterium mucogenicum]MCX8564330.1 hypothetical protein [Mycolicibacterium mucogenicum]
MANTGPFPPWDGFSNWDSLANWDPFKPLDALSSFWSSAAGRALTSGPVGAYQTLFDTLRKQLVGRRMTVKLKSGEMTLTVTAIDADLEVRSLSVGQLNTVSISAADIVWNGWQFDNATAVPFCVDQVHRTHQTAFWLLSAPRSRSRLRQMPLNRPRVRFFRSGPSPIRRRPAG